MKDVLARGQQPLLERFARSNVLLAFDYDGTLAPIVADPERAAMRPRTRALLAGVAALYPCIVISGRARADACARIDGVAVAGVVGNHGSEGPCVRSRAARRVARWRRELEAQLADVPGVAIEDKTYSLTLHYRRCPRSREAVLRAARSLGPATRILGGKCVVNVLPGDAPHKGDALKRERRRLRCDAAIYVGDDETDEDVFQLDDATPLLGIRVGARGTSHAAYCIRSQRQIDPLLRTLGSLRT